MITAPRNNFLVGAVLIAALGSSPASSIEITEGPTLTMDPYSVAPLAGVVELTTDVPARVTLTISDGVVTWIVEFSGYDTQHSVPVLGLRANSSYTVDVMVVDQSDDSLTGSPTLEANTGPLPADMPVFEVLQSDPSKMEPGFTLIDRIINRVRDAPPETPYTTIVDRSGHIVWYSTMGDNAIRKLSNGNLIYKTGTDSVIELALLGNIVSQINPGLNLHHDLFPTAHGTFLSINRGTIITQDFPTSETDPNAPRETAEVEDNPIVEFATDGTLLNSWAFDDLIDPVRLAYLSLNPRPFGYDWVHTNAVIHDPRDDSILTSVRHQDAIVKFSRSTGDLIWILAPHDNWSPQFRSKLLIPVGAPFEWQFHQHAMMYTTEGTLLLFDNGNFRASPFDGTEPDTEEQSYSRAVEYSIDEDTMEISQVWEYGSRIAEPLYSGSRGDADWMPITGNVLVTFSNVSFEGGVSSEDLGLGEGYARIVEVTHESPAETVFDLRVYNPEGRISVYRSERIASLYASDVTVGGDLDRDGVMDNRDNCFERSNPRQLDGDADGVGNPCDSCPATADAPTVVIDSCASGVANTLDSSGCSISDAVAEIAATAGSHQQFLKALRQLAADLVRDGVITEAEQRALRPCPAPEPRRDVRRPFRRSR